MKSFLTDYFGKSMETNYKSSYILDNINIQQIKELSAKLEESKINHDLVNQKSYTERIISKIGQLSPEVKDKFNILTYILHSELSTSLINEREYQEAINHLEIARSMLEYENNEDINKCILLRLLSFSKLFLGLNIDSESLIREAKEINQKLLNSVGKITSGELKKQVLDDKNIIEAWETDNLKTIIEFEIPFPLMITDHPIKFEYNNIKHIIGIELIPSPINPLSTSGGAFAEIVEDKYGLAHWSKIKLTFYRYIDPFETLELNILAEDKRVSKILLETIKVMNFFIERYRVSSKKYWLENIFHKMISKYECKVIAGTLEFNKVNMLNSQLTKIQFGVSDSPNDNLEEFEENLKEDSLELWELLLLDSKDYLFKRSYRESIYAINGAFENYLMIKAQEILSRAWGQENAIEYLKGIPIYEYHKMKDYMNEKTFHRAVKGNVINPYVPPVNQILKECNIIQPFTIPRKELNRLVGKIRKYRNEVMHGVKIDEDLEKVSFEAIKSFEDFVKYFN